MSDNQVPMSSRTVHVACLLICLIGFLACLLIFYPGFMSGDSVEQYGQALSGVYNNHHPVAMSLLWHFLMRIGPGPYPVLVFQELALWGGFALASLWLIKRGKVVAAVLMALIGYLPPVVAISGVIWKDVHMAASFLLSCSLLLWANEARPRGLAMKILTIASILFLTYGASTRHNSVAAWIFLSPAYVSTALHAFNLGAQSRLTGLAISFLILLVPLTASRTLELTSGAQDAHIAQFVQLYDLAGASVRARRILFPQWVTEGSHYSTKKLARWYVRSYESPLFFDFYPERGIFETTNDPDKLSSLAQAWKSAWIHYPAQMIGHRLDCFLSLLTPSRAESRSDLYWGIESNNFGIRYAPTRAAAILFPTLFRYRLSLPFIPMVWLCLACVGAFLACRKGQKVTHAEPALRWALSLFFSAVGYIVSYAVVYVANDFRYVYWSVIATCAGWVFLHAAWTPGPTAASPVERAVGRRNV